MVAGDDLRIPTPFYMCSIDVSLCRFWGCFTLIYNTVLQASLVSS